MRKKATNGRGASDKPGRHIEDEKTLKRWHFVMSGQVSIAPVCNEDGEVMYMVVESNEHFAKCRNSEELNIAVDIAIYKAEYMFEQFESVH